MRVLLYFFTCFIFRDRPGFGCGSRASRVYIIPTYSYTTATSASPFQSLRGRRIPVGSLSVIPSLNSFSTVPGERYLFHQFETAQWRRILFPIMGLARTVEIHPPKTSTFGTV